MGLLDRFRRAQATPANTAAGWQSGAWLGWECPRNVVRESHYQHAFAKLCGPVCREGYLVPVHVRLRRDPANPSDPNAVGVYVVDEQVGWLRAEAAAQVAADCDRAGISEWAVAGLIRGGSGRADYFGVYLWMSRLTEPGPLEEFAPDLWEVSWPPGRYEDDCQRQLRWERRG